MSRAVSVIVAAILAYGGAVSIHASNAQSASIQADGHGSHHGPGPDSSLAAQVREVTRVYRDINQAIAAGYKQFGGCVSGPEVGAMGIHFVTDDLVDGTLEADRPEALLYEFKNGMARLVGVEYITPAPAWDPEHDGPPVLSGQHFQFVGTPNRYRLPALYELHVWAWRENPNGTFVDWNPHVSCDGAA